MNCIIKIFSMLITIVDTIIYFIPPLTIQSVNSVAYLMVTIFPMSMSALFTWAMKSAATASYRAVPSMLMVAPTGMTKLLTRGSTLLLCSRHFKVTGIVAELHTNTNITMSYYLGFLLSIPFFSAFRPPDLLPTHPAVKLPTRNKYEHNYIS